MTDPTEITEATEATEATEPERPTVMGLLADRWGMTEGQLYTSIIALVVALLLTVTGLPTAHQRSDTDSLSGGGAVPVAPPPTTAAPAPTAAPTPTSQPAPEVP